MRNVTCLTFNTLRSDSVFIWGKCEIPGILIVIFHLFEVQNLFKFVLLASDRSQTNNPLRLSVWMEFE